jgi:hypothetical protein
MAAGNQDRWRRNQANRTKDQVEIEILDLGRKQEDLREQSAFVPKGVPDCPGSISRPCEGACGHTDYRDRCSQRLNHGGGWMKGPTTVAGESAISIRI